MAGGAERWVHAAGIVAAFLFLLASVSKRVGVSKGVVAALVGCFLVSYFSVFFLLHPLFPRSHIVRYAGRRWIVEGRILPPLNPGLEKTHLTVDVEKLLTHDQHSLPVFGRVRVTVYGPYTRTVYVGDTVRFVSRISGVSPPANPHAFHYQRFLAFRRVYATAVVSGFSQLVVLQRGNNKPSWRGLVDRLRQHLNRWITASIPSPYNALASAFLIGYRGQIPPSMREVFIRCGASHLIAISGLHLGIVSVLLFFCIRWGLALFPKIFLYIDVQRITAVLTFVLLLLYLALTGARVSTVRSFVMAAAFLAVLFFRRTSRLEDILFLAAFVILFFQPQAVYSVSFQLTFAAVGGILLGVGSRGAKEGREKGETETRYGAFRWVGRTLVLTLLAVAATFPITAYHFHRASPMSLVANLFGVPYVGFVMLPLGLFSLVIYPFSEPLATFLLRIDGIFVQILVRVFEFFARFPHSRIWVYPPRWYEIVFYYTGFVFTVSAFRSKTRQGRRRGILLALGSAGLLVVAFGISWALGRPTLTVFSVKKGAYLAIRQKDGRALLVCNGAGDALHRNDAKWVLLPYLLHERIRALEAVVLTNNEPVNLRTAARILEYRRPRYLVGTPAVLYSLKTALPAVPAGIVWVSIPRALCVGEVVIGVRPHSHSIAHRGDVVLTFRGLNILVVSRRGGKRVLDVAGCHLCVVPALGSRMPRMSVSDGFLGVIRYPVGKKACRSRAVDGKGLFDLCRDGAVILVESRKEWRLTTFRTRRTRVIEKGL